MFVGNFKSRDDERMKRLTQMNLLKVMADQWSSGNFNRNIPNKNIQNLFNLSTVSTFRLSQTFQPWVEPNIPTLG